MDAKEKIEYLKNWLGTGSINIFGLPMSGKDTVGVRLAELLDAKFLSSGMIIRAYEEETRKNYTGNGDLAPTDLFYDVVLPYFSREDLKPFPLVLSSVGRWSGEENEVMDAAFGAGHGIRIVVLLQISEKDVLERWESSRMLEDRGERIDDKERAVFEHRCDEFRKKTMPVILHYRSMGLLVEVRGDGTRERVFSELIEKLYDFAKTH